MGYPSVKPYILIYIHDADMLHGFEIIAELL